MKPLTENEIRASFVNASKREAREASVPDLSAVSWDDLDFLGWRDAKRERDAYVVVELGDDVVGLRLTTAAPKGPRRKAVCAWCQDVVVEDDVSLYVARRTGAAGKRGNTIGTMICSDFGCSANVRRQPALTEVVSDNDADRAWFVQQRVAGLQERAARFARSVLRGE
ncbi:FBP domain-containing protein [Flexivirga sp. ID2601S]|uniref:FBP domain-containing protein n=1 Tax=Flexivirga aerilata TaxID=1656889 RepID=A0A849AKR7_9MICO|nr:FBP domain-containing protein [Flexivirga aerilata]NNG41005.1 FBP domain-containing protein [Flexivirga aerilata]